MQCLEIDGSRFEQISKRLIHVPLIHGEFLNQAVFAVYILRKFIIRFELQKKSIDRI
jgi:hypothetical protein